MVSKICADVPENLRAEGEHVKAELSSTALLPFPLPEETKRKSPP